MKPTLQIVIPAAGSGKRLQELNNGCPKAILRLRGKTMIQRQIITYLDAASAFDVQFIFILGASHEKVESVLKSISNVNYKIVYNSSFASTNCGTSLAKALPLITCDWLYSNSDLLVSPQVAEKLICNPCGNLVGVNYGEFTDLHRFSTNAENLISRWMPIDIGQKGIHSSQQLANADGEIVGPIKNQPYLAHALYDIYQSLSDLEKKNISCYTLFSRLKHPCYTPVDITNDLWKEIDTIDDYKAADLTASKIDNIA